jgi:prenyltransferase beta subunit
MTRRLSCLGLVLLVPCAVAARPPTAAEKTATLAYLASLRKSDGGYAADADPRTPATVPATSSALRAIRYFGGQPDNPAATLRFLLSCRHIERGGFGPQPGAAPEVRTTALALMACRELAADSLSPSEVRDIFRKYLAAEARTFEEIRIAAAAYEAWYDKQPDPALDTLRQKWLAQVRQDRQPDGSWGRGEGAARDTASAVVTLLRLGASREEDLRQVVRDKVLAAQRSDGGWGKAGSSRSDLETTYRVMRCLHMLGLKPDVAKCQAFVHSCRQPDGSYSLEPGQPGNASSTYFAGIVLHWLQ